MSQSSLTRVTQRVRFIDSHTAGEPTRVILDGFPPVPGATLAEQRERLMRDADVWRSLVNNEPRGHDVLVSALRVTPQAEDCVAGVIFFNNVGPLGMCGHGTMGVIATLAYLGEIGPGDHRIETPVGVVGATLHEDGRVSVQNVPAERYRHGVELQVPGLGEVRGDVAWGGNWFFLTAVDAQDLHVGNVPALTAYADRIRQTLISAGVTGRNGAAIDHIELFGDVDGASRNFVLCPGGAFDRSPCGTGTSAKMACLAAEGKLAPGQRWVQQSVIGTEFEGHYRWVNGRLHPIITGRAYITAEGELIVQSGDPFAWGMRPDAPQETGR